jgi:hypothetical protein
MYSESTVVYVYGNVVTQNVKVHFSKVLNTKELDTT